MIMVLLLVTLVKWIDSVCLKEKSNVNPSIAVLFKVTSVGRIFLHNIDQLVDWQLTLTKWDARIRLQIHFPMPHSVDVSCWFSICLFCFKFAYSFS